MGEANFYYFTCLHRAIDDLAMSDYLQSHYENELRENQRTVKEVSFERYAFRTEAMVELVFCYCRAFGFDAQTRILALEIFDHFFPKYLEETRSKCEETNQCWDSIFANIMKQIPLRILSCIQLASKLHGNKNRVQPEQILALLSHGKDTYRLETVVISEIRVFKTL